MTDLKKSSEKIVFFDVKGNNTLSYFFDVEHQSIVSPVESPECRVELSESAYKRLLAGETTFEIEATNAELKVYGNHDLLRGYGASLRSQI